MNENFKKVIEAIAEMKSMFAKTSMEFAEATLMDGTTISFEGDVLAEGVAVFVGEAPAPEGTYELADGGSVVVDANGVVTEVIEASNDEEMNEDTPGRYPNAGYRISR